jgi:hypothetical protein
LRFSNFSFKHHSFTAGSSNIFRVLKAFLVKFNWVTLRNDIQIKEDAIGGKSGGHWADKNWGQNKSAGNPERKRLLGREA